MWDKVCDLFKPDVYCLDYCWEGNWQRAKVTFEDKERAIGYGKALMDNLAKCSGFRIYIMEE